MGKVIVASKKAGKTTAKKINHKFTIDCKMPIEDNVIVLTDFESFLKSKIKVSGKAGNLGKDVTVTKTGEAITVQATIAFSKRYLKYLTKKYLKKQDLKEYLRVVSSNKNTYELRYFNIQNDEAAE
jgi:large subunit ribosomal protein L22e